LDAYVDPGTERMEDVRDAEDRRVDRNRHAAECVLGTEDAAGRTAARPPLNWSYATKPTVRDALSPLLGTPSRSGGLLCPGSLSQVCVPVGTRRVMPVRSPASGED
jgi:hypothetical protein